MLTVSKLVIYFIIYSFIGWLLEVFMFIVQDHKLVNRGFLIGPVCPIYGCGVLLIVFLIDGNKSDLLSVFLKSIFICSVLEYSTSYLMEKLFKARWWDYSKRRFNLDGRVCLGTLIPFGLFGLILTYFTNPFLINCFNKVDMIVLNIIAGIVFAIYIIDNIISTIIIIGFRKTTIKIGMEKKEDNTEDITRRVREILAQKSWGYRRLIDAFPGLETIKLRIQEITNEVKENVNEIKENINEKAEDLKNVINDKKEEVKNTISNKTENMRTTIINTKTSFVKSMHNNSEKVKLSLDLNKAKFKTRFFNLKK